jgi:hypothetical protein
MDKNLKFLENFNFHVYEKVIKFGDNVTKIPPKLSPEASNSSSIQYEPMTSGLFKFYSNNLNIF